MVDDNNDSGIRITCSSVAATGVRVSVSMVRLFVRVSVSRCVCVCVHEGREGDWVWCSLPRVAACL